MSTEGSQEVRKQSKLSQLRFKLVPAETNVTHGHHSYITVKMKRTNYNNYMQVIKWRVNPPHHRLPRQAVALDS